MALPQAAGLWQQKATARPMPDTAANPLSAQTLRSRAGAIVRSPWFWLPILALQFVALQAVLRVQIGDAPRNLHWVLLTADDPRFLIDGTDPLEMVDGFVPDPPELAPRGFARPPDDVSGFHRWWGPVPILLLVPVWQLSESYLLLALTLPFIAGLVVLACFHLGRWLFDAQTALLAALFLAFFPVFFQHAIISYSEPVSMLFLLLAVHAYLRGNTPLAALCGSLTVLCKLDMVLVYPGIIGISLLYRLWAVWQQQRDRRSLVHPLVALLLPVAAAMGWFWLRTGSPIPAGTGAGLSLAVFRILLPDMLSRMLFLQWYVALATLLLIGGCAVVGLRSPRLTHEQRLVFAAWVGLGLLVLLVYAATPGAANSPRVFLPSLPALALLFAAGVPRLPAAWRRRIGFYIGALFLAVALFISYFFASYAPYLRAVDSLMPTLRELPHGMVLTRDYWYTMLYTRQPATWFEGDPDFREHILHNRDNFRAYTRQYPQIRYVPVPRPALEPLVAQSYQPIDTDLFRPEVLDYMQTEAECIPVPPYYDLCILPLPDSADTAAPVTSGVTGP